MSRSYRHTPIRGVAGNSDKYGKRLANRRLRVLNRIRIREAKEPLLLREVSNPWDWAKDGKFYWDSKDWFVDDPEHRRKCLAK